MTVQATVTWPVLRMRILVLEWELSSPVSGRHGASTSSAGATERTMSAEESHGSKSTRRVMTMSARVPSGLTEANGVLMLARSAASESCPQLRTHRRSYSTFCRRCHAAPSSLTVVEGVASTMTLDAGPHSSTRSTDVGWRTAMRTYDPARCGRRGGRHRHRQGWRRRRKARCRSLAKPVRLWLALASQVST